MSGFRTKLGGAIGFDGGALVAGAEDSFDCVGMAVSEPSLGDMSLTQELSEKTINNRRLSLETNPRILPIVIFVSPTSIFVLLAIAHIFTKCRKIKIRF